MRRPQQDRTTVRGAIAGLACAAVVLSAGDGLAFERQWKAGLEGGYALAGFAPSAVSGFSTGIHLTYGLTDAVNLRAHSDVSAFDLPEPATSAVIWHTGFGAEYVIDILTWVPYVGATLGPSPMFVQDGTTRVHLGLEGLGGLGYQLSRSFTVGVEARYRALLFGTEGESPTHNLLVQGRLEYAWGY